MRSLVLAAALSLFAAPALAQGLLRYIRFATVDQGTLTRRIGEALSGREQ